MHNKIKTFVGLLLIFTFGTVQADCIVTTKNFTKSSRVIYINPTNGSDQLAKNYNYNLGSLRNPYEPRRIVAFQNINEALAARNPDNGDLVLIKSGPTWTNYDVWSQNKTTEFNAKTAEVSGYSQRQCRGENLTWVPSAVTDNQSADTAPLTEFSNNNDITVANTELVTPSNPTTNQASTSSLQNTTSTSSPRKSSGGSSSGGSSTGSNSLNNGLDNVTDLQQTTTSSTRALRNQPKGATADSTDVLAGVDPTIIEETVNDTDVPSIENGQDKVNSVNTPECTGNAPWENAIQTYSQDSNGWSIIEPDSETRIVYVSSSDGSDNFARPYMSAEISDPFNPNKPIQAYKSVKAALSQLRDGKPDWILFKRGDKFELQETIKLHSGKSAKAHLVLSSYGDGDKRPLIDSKNNSGIILIKGRSHITVKGLEFYASSFDPKSPNFIGWGNSKGSESGFASLSTENVSGFVLEDNIFNFYKSNIVFSGFRNYKNIVVRRNLVMNAYSENSHSQGIYISNSEYVLMEENIFDHNGWYQQRPSNIKLNTRTYGYATFYNHNIYISNSSNLVIRENLSSRSSSIGMKFTSNPNKETKVNTVNSSNILLKNNIIVEGEVGFSIGGNTNFNNGYRWDNILVIDNVLTNIGRTKPTNRNLAFNIEASDWDTGTICSNTIVDGNDKETSNIYGIATNGYAGDITVINNKIVNFGLESELYTSNDNVSSQNNQYTPQLKNINFLDNYVKSKGAKDYATYIDSIKEKLRNNLTEYYSVHDALKYIKLQATN